MDEEVLRDMRATLEECEERLEAIDGDEVSHLGWRASVWLSDVIRRVEMVRRRMEAELPKAAPHELPETRWRGV